MAKRLAVLVLVTCFSLDAYPRRNSRRSQYLVPGEMSPISEPDVYQSQHRSPNQLRSRLLPSRASPLDDSENAPGSWVSEFLESSARFMQRLTQSSATRKIETFQNQEVQRRREALQKVLDEGKRRAINLAGSSPKSASLISAILNQFPASCNQVLAYIS